MSRNVQVTSDEIKWLIAIADRRPTSIYFEGRRTRSIIRFHVPVIFVWLLSLGNFNFSVLLNHGFVCGSAVVHEVKNIGERILSSRTSTKWSHQNGYAQLPTLEMSRFSRLWKRHDRRRWFVFYLGYIWINYL